MEISGAIVVDKDPGWTSHDVVNKVRRLAGTKRVGHLGTLDPLATGVLPLLLNRATRLAQFFGTNDKTYQAVVRFGQATDSYDADGAPVGLPVDIVLSPASLEHAFRPFQGAFLQTPPPVSAKKIAGVPAYKLARQKKEVRLEPVPVTVSRLDIRSVEGTDVAIEIDCTAGTYIRAIAHEAGQRLGCGAHLVSLRRTASGSFQIGQAHTLTELAELAGAGRFSEALVPAAELLPEFPTEVVDAVAEAHIRNGREFRVSPFRARGATRYVRALSRGGELVAIGEARLPTVFHPIVVL